MPPGRARGGPSGSARPSVDQPPTKALRPAPDGSPPGRRWDAAVASVPLGLAARTVAGALGDRADRHGRVRATPAELAAGTCLGVVAVSDALAVLGSYGLVARDGSAYVLTVPEVARW